MEGRIRVVIRCMSSNIADSVDMEFDIALRSSVLDLKALITGRHRKKPTAAEQILIFKGKVLDNSMLLHQVLDSLIDSNTITIHLIVRLQGGDPNDFRRMSIHAPSVSVSQERPLVEESPPYAPPSPFQLTPRTESLTSTSHQSAMTSATAHSDQRDGPGESAFSSSPPVDIARLQEAINVLQRSWESADMSGHSGTNGDAVGNNVSSGANASNDTTAHSPNGHDNNTGDVDNDVPNNENPQPAIHRHRHHHQHPPRRFLPMEIMHLVFSRFHIFTILKLSLVLYLLGQGSNVRLAIGLFAILIYFVVKVIDFKGLISFASTSDSGRVDGPNSGSNVTSETLLWKFARFFLAFFLSFLPSWTASHPVLR